MPQGAGEGKRPFCDACDRSAGEGADAIYRIDSPREAVALAVVGDRVYGQLHPGDRQMSPMRIALHCLAALAILLGFVWIGQGSGHFPYPASSFMIDQSPWIMYGAILAVAGVAGLVRLRRR